ncbi:MAG: GNAT family N-acetyltransferase [Smithellaceae bacterium]
MNSPDKSEKLKSVLNSLPGIEVINTVEIEQGFVKSLSIATNSVGVLEVHRIEVDNAMALFEFYTAGLSEKPKQLFAPYPLFHTPPKSAKDLAQRIADWQKEDDWTAISLSKGKKIIGCGLLKRFRSEQATSAIVIRDVFLSKGMGCLLQHIIVEQARLLNLPRFHVKVVSDNYASVRLHEKCGFRETRRLPSELYSEMFKYLSDWDKKNGQKRIDRHLIEMVIDLN